MSQAISEKFSENRRGRPVVMSAEDEAILNAFGLFTECHTRRSKLNVFYRQRAIGILKDGDYKWLFDESAIMKGTDGKKHIQPTILTELGRIDDDEAMRDVALQICKLKPKTRDAVLMIRRVRTGGLPLGDALQLANKIIHTINQYLHGHAGVTKEQVFDALATAKQSVDESLD